MPKLEVDIVAEEKRLREYWQLRDSYMLKDREILNLVKPKKTSDQIKWVNNEPKVFYDTAKALISSYPPRFRLPLSVNYSPEEKAKMNKAERFAMGIMRALDRQVMERGCGGGWVRELAHWVLSGWYAVFTHIERNGKDIEFVADLFDPITVYPEWDNKGLVRCIRSYEVDKAVAISMAEGWASKGLKFEYIEPKDKEKIRVINWWYRDPAGKVWNAILFDDQIIKDITLEKKFKRIPIFVGAIGSPERTSADWVTRFGENIIAANRDMYEYENIMMSLMATIMAETAYPNIISKTMTGAPAVKSEGLKGYADVVSLKIGETIELLKHATTPEEANILLGMVRSQRQKGSVPDIVYGGVPFELSGFAISQLMAAIKYKLAPYLNTMQYALSSIVTEFLTQYKRGNYPPITLSMSNPRGLEKGQFFVEEFTPEDVPESLYVEVTIPITSAMDKTQQIIFARQALAPPQLVSRETIWDEIMDIQDAEQEYARILQDEMLEMPVVKQIGLIEQLREREQGYRNEGKVVEADALHRYIMMLEMQIGMRQGVPATPSAGGIPSSAMPPEAMNSPDMARSALGVPPPGLNRRPQTKEEREESKGRKGRLVSPTGDTLL